MVSITCAVTIETPFFVALRILKVWESNPWSKKYPGCGMLRKKCEHIHGDVWLPKFAGLVPILVYLSQF